MIRRTSGRLAAAVGEQAGGPEQRRDDADGVDRVGDEAVAVGRGVDVGHGVDAGRRPAVTTGIAP